MRSRNIAINAYLGMLVVTLIGGSVTLFLVHVAYDMPFKAFASSASYQIDLSL